MQQRITELLPHVVTMLPYITEEDAQQLVSTLSFVLSNALREMERGTADLRKLIQAPPPALAEPHRKKLKKRKTKEDAEVWNPEVHGHVLHIVDCSKDALMVLARQSGQTPLIATRAELAKVDAYPEQYTRMTHSCLAYFLPHPLRPEDEALFRGLTWGDAMLAALHERDYFYCDGAGCGREFMWQDAGYSRPLSRDPRHKAYCADCLLSNRIDPQDVLTAEGQH